MNILIVEDEAHTASLLQEIVERDPEFLVIQRLESVVETVQYLTQHQQNIDLMFLDIQLADGKSFEIFKHIDIVIPIIFCTAYDQYTLEAIKNNGIDYVLKPFKEEEIHTALQKYKNLAARLQSKVSVPFQPIPVTNYQKNFLTQKREKSRIIPTQDIAIFWVQNDIVSLYTFKAEKLPLFKKLEYVENVCDPYQFFRVNRQMLINRDAIHSFEPYFNRKVVVHLNVTFEEQIIVSRLKVTPFKEWLQQ